MKRKISMLLILLLISINLVSCIKINEKQSDDKNKEIVYAVPSIPITLNIDGDVTAREDDLICSLFEGLLECDKNGQVIPSLASAWKISNDGIDYTFLIRENAKWSDGSKIKAEDFVKFFKEILSPGLKNSNVKELFCIYGAKQYNEGKTTFEKGVAISAEDESTLKIRMNYKVDGFLNLLTKPRYRLRVIDEKLDNYINTYKDIKYTGAYKIKYALKDDSIRLTKNNNYNFGNKDIISNIKLKVMQGEEMSFAGFNTNKVDLLLNPPVSSLERINSERYLQMYPTNTVTTLVFNENNKISAQIEFRKAIWKALMWEIFDADLVKNNFQEVALGEFVRKERPDNEIMANSNITDNSKQKDVKRQEANEIFTKLKIGSGNITLVALDNADNRNMANFIQKKLVDNNKLKIVVNFYGEEELKQVLLSRNYNMYLKDYTIEQNSMISFLNQWRKSDINIVGFKDNEYEKILDKLNSANNKEEVNSLIIKAEGILKEKLPFIPLCFNNMIWCKSEKIKELYIDGNGNIIFKYISANKEGV